MSSVAPSTSHTGVSTDQPVRTIREGVFFSTPSDLPKGRHGLSREAVRAAQAERMMIAVTELMAAYGYRVIGVREIAARARVSAAAYYQCYPDKDACVFAAYERFIDVLLTALARPLESPQTWESTVTDVLRAYLTTLASDLVVARAFQVEMDALGRRARDVRRGSLTGMAAILKARREEVWPTHHEVELEAYVGAVYAVRQLASDALDEEHTPDLAALAVRTEPWIRRLLSEKTPESHT